jgi:putative transposase
VGPICAALEFPSSTYYAAKRREVCPPARAVRDEELKEQIMAVWDQPGPGRRIYGARKIWLELNAAGIAVGRCTVERLMRELGIAGVGTRAKKPRTTVPAGADGLPDDLLERDFGAEAPNARWVADITYVPTASGWCYAAFVMDLYSRAIVGWAVADHLRAELALDALEMGIWARRHRIEGPLIHHSDYAEPCVRPRNRGFACAGGVSLTDSSA